IASGELSPADRAAFGEFVGARRFLHTSAATELTGVLYTQFEQILASPQYRDLERAETAIMAAGDGLGIDPGTWRGAVDPTIESLREFEGASIDPIIAQATPVIVGTIVRLILLGVLGLAAVIASIIISIT